jgi:hypothetical protein
VLKPEIRAEILNVHPREVYQDTTVPDALDSVLNYAADKQEKMIESVRFELAQRFSRLRDEALLAELMRDVESWLKIFYFAMLYRINAHVEELAGAFNDRRYLPVASATRALLELFFLLYTTYRQVFRLNNDSKATNDISKAIQNEIAIRDLLVKQIRATRLNWDNPYGREWEQVQADCRQTNVQTMMDKLPDETRELVKRWYGILSDVSHPNFGSILYVMDHERINQASGTLAFARSPGKRAQLEMTLDLVSAPLGFACIQHVAFLSVLEKVLVHYREGVDRFTK